MILIIQNEGFFDVGYHLNYDDDEVDITAVTSLISALDSFGGIDSAEAHEDGRTDALETIEHEGNLVIVEKSQHFVMALMVSNDTSEDEQRRTMASLLVEIEQKYTGTWESWEGDNSVFEPSIFNVLSKLPLMSISFWTLKYSIGSSSLNPSF